ncbi:SoxR reducing system RseC family protein [candidate division WOR-3 bacterium]|nr:SoxR reducing system RseC family protein [candidate division WOR-3 bacterium]
MIEEAGRVVAVQGGRAEVEVAPHGGCEHCGAAGICNWAGKREKRVFARNKLGAAVGQSVVLGRTEKGGALSALAVFGVPGGLLLLGIVAGTVLAGDKWAAGLGGAGLLAGLVVVRVLDRAAARSGRNLPVVLRLVTEEECKGDASDEDPGSDSRQRGDVGAGG